MSLYQAYLRSKIIKIPNLEVEHVTNFIRLTKEIKM